jgi:hypothetical protein
MFARSICCLAVSLFAGGIARADATSLSFREPPAEGAKPAATVDSSQPTVCPPIPPQASDEFHVFIDPTLWYVGPSGKFALPVRSGTGPGAFTTEGDKIRVNDLDLDTTRLRPAGSLAVSTGHWRFSFTGSEYELARAASAASTSGRLGSVAFASGDRLKLDFSFGTYELDAGYRIADYDFRPGCTKQDFVVDAYLFVHAFIGARIYDVNMAAEGVGGTSPGARAEESNVFAEPIIGARAEAVIASDFSLVLQLSAGGMALYSTTSYSLDVSLAFQWRPIEHVGVQIGWRQLAFNLVDGKGLDRFEYTGRLAGLFAGVTIQF